MHFVARWSNLRPFSPVFFWAIISRKHYTEVFAAFLKAVHGCIMRSRYRGLQKADIEGGSSQCSSQMLKSNDQVNNIALVVDLN